MRIGLLSDIHSNAHALRAVLKSAKEKDVERLLCCGDYVGYYYEPEKVIALLDNWEWDGISGNHESMLKDWVNKKDRNKILFKYGSGISYAARKLTTEVLARFYLMPNTKKLFIDSYKIFLCHGSPWNQDVYIYPDADQSIVNRMFEFNSDVDILVYGHSHYPAFWEQGNKKIVNPGSVGQPRNRKPGASWVLWDTTLNTFQFLRESYDASPVIEMCKKIDPKIKYLSNVLVRE
tara:strand:+ start:218 stop:919 length:702 start_codon:yes stop_codon:yes gene_type:complete